MRFHARQVILASLLAAAGCPGDEQTDDSAADATGGTGSASSGEGQTEGADSSGGGEFGGPSSADDPVCQEQFAFCGDVLVPADLVGTPASMAVALYSALPAAGPPDVIVTEIESPALVPGERFPVVVQPLLDTGEFFVLINLYMEGGGTFVPVAGVDYMGETDATMVLDGSPASFGEITLSLVTE